MGRERDRGDWIPWYCDDSPGWLELSLAARGAAEGIARKMGRKRSELHLGSRGLKGLAVLLRCRWEELEPAIAELTTGPHPRFVMSEDGRVLIDPEHESRRRPTSAERVSRHRKKVEANDTAPESGDVTPVTVTPVSSDHVTPVTGASVSSPLLSSDLISSSEADQDHLTGGSRPPDPPPADPLGPPPPWFAKVVETIATTCMVDLRLADCWIRYAGHSADKGKRPNEKHAAYWVNTVMVPEAREEAKSESRQRQRDAKYDAARSGPTPIPRETPEQAKEFARRLAERVASRKGAA